MTEAAELVGWAVVGPMESVCVHDARTAAEARAHYPYRFIADVWEIRADTLVTMGEVPCSVCGRRIL